MEMRNNRMISEPTFKYRLSDGIQIKAIEFEAEQLRIDFVAKPDLQFDYDWWINIEYRTFIRVSGTNVRLPMCEVANIPLAPNKYFFETKDTELKYSLYFILPPPSAKRIDIIEKEWGGNNSFNFYGVALSESLSPPLFEGGVKLELN